MERKKERGDRGERGREAAGRKRSLPPSTLMTPPKPLALPLVSHFLNETITAAEAVASLARAAAAAVAGQTCLEWQHYICDDGGDGRHGGSEGGTGEGRVTETAGHSLGRQRAGTGFAW